VKKLTVKIANKIQGSPIAEFVFGFGIVLGTIWLAFGAFNVAEGAWYRSRPASDFFNYESVEYVKTDGNTLVFASNRIIKRSSPIDWNDVLFCDDGEEYHFYSNQESGSDNPKLALDYRTVTWNYTEPIPMGRSCYLESQITMTVKGYPKKQVITGDNFKLK